MSVAVRKLENGSIWVVEICRPAVRNAVDRATAEELHRQFLAFDEDPVGCVAILTGQGEHFCAGADLKAVDAGQLNQLNPNAGTAPMGPSRMLLSKPTIAAVEGFAVAGGLELALFCDMRVCGESATLGVFCRRFGVPLIDGGTIRLPRIIGMGRAMDLIVTGRPVRSDEAQQIGLVNRVVPAGKALEAAIALAQQISKFPQHCLRQDRLNALALWSRDLESAGSTELRQSRHIVGSESVAGASQFSRDRVGRGGTFTGSAGSPSLILGSPACRL